MGTKNAADQPGNPINRESVRQVLRRWRSVEQLGNHPLAGLAIVEAKRQSREYPDTLLGRGKALQEVLLDAIEQLKPTETTPDPQAPRWRAYLVLTGYYVEGKRKLDLIIELAQGASTIDHALQEARDRLVIVLQVMEQEHQPPELIEEIPGVDSTQLRMAQRVLLSLPEQIIPEPKSLPAGSRIVLSPNPLFVGRQDDLRRLASAMKAGTITAISQVGIAATTGLGGIGKTQLASEFVHRYGYYFAGGVFWLSFADGKTIPGEIAACGGSGGMNLRSDYHMLPLEEQVQLVRAAWQSPIPRLLVFDNCEDESLLEMWRPPAGGCRILVTSRRTQWDVILNVQQFSIDVLRRDESIALLRKHRPDLEPDDPTLDAIAAEVGDLPLALHLAGSYLAKYRDVTTPEGYLLTLRSPPSLEHPSLQTGGLSPTRHEQHVARTFELSYQRLDPTNPIDALGIAILARVACFAPGEPIPRDLLVSALPRILATTHDAFQVEDALIWLTELGLLERQEHQSFRLHRLLVAFVAMKAPDPSAQNDVEQSMCERVQFFNQKSLFPPVLPWQQHVRSITGKARERGDETGADLCVTTGNHLWILGDSSDAQAYFEAALAIYQQKLGPHHMKTIDTIEWLGLICQLQGKLDQARKRFEEVLMMRQQQLGDHHLDTATTHNNLGALLRIQGHFAEARAHLEKSLMTRRRILGLKNPHTARSLNNLGYLLYALAEYRRALRYYKLALAIRQQILDPNHLATAQSLNNVGEVLWCLGEYDGAWNYHQQALKMRLQVLGDRHFDTAESFHNLGNVRSAQASYAEAQGYFEQGYAIYQHLSGETPILYIQILCGLACAHRDQGHYDVALRLFEEGIAKVELYSDEMQVEKAKLFEGLGVLYLQLGSVSVAQTFLDQAHALYSQILGDSHPDTAYSLYYLSRLRQAQGDIPAARSTCEQAKRILEQRLGTNHPKTMLVRKHGVSLL